MSKSRPSRSICLVLAFCALGLVSMGGCSRGGALPESLRNANRLVVAPMNLAVKLPIELEDGVDPVREEIITYLQRRHAHVAIIWPEDAWRLWRESMAAAIADAPAGGRIEAAVGRFVTELRQHAEFGAFMLPTLAYREAKVWGQTARWDGVRRRLSLRGRVDAGAQLQTLDAPIGESSIAGQRVPGVSLHVLVFSPEGTRTFESWGGLDLVHAALVTGSTETGHGSLVQDTSPFRDRENLREGVAIALDRYKPGRRR